MRRKGDLPAKICVVCGRPFAWRRKWAKVWDEVRYCSDACRKKASASRSAGETALSMVTSLKSDSGRPGRKTP
ncbi:DUF2256 domain-containing protein [Acidisoma sp.]|uniref:DUF2256 domain-containing protein n=1 Tax=Acidisoma sp. TaxID=1872115 RepID=UPI003B00B293